MSETSSSGSNLSGTSQPEDIRRFCKETEDVELPARKVRLVGVHVADKISVSGSRKGWTQNCSAFELLQNEDRPK